MNTRLPTLSMRKALALALTLALAFAPGAHAEKADRGKPMNIEADALRHDELKQTSVFTGRVVMTKGTIVLRGAQLEVRQDADGFQYGVVTAEAGKRAFFRQKRDTPPGAPDEFVEGEGEVIEYDGRADNVKLIRRAELRRYREATLTDELTGALIVYNNLTDVFTVDGQKTAPAGTAAGTPGGRVRAVLAPKEPAPGAATPPARTEPPVLRASPRLDGAK
ncbi:lipopolysaccharide transport periplasmic protein LptA [Diaphorobacter sp.]|uniref:lipopolysaccharide transport periplasmic protein LptA n=1 Tax=Diaphorobacter sp. TaxID=1934310 RepID=UPI003D11BB18